jgi:Ca-activated chloride channel family protein
MRARCNVLFYAGLTSAILPLQTFGQSFLLPQPHQPTPSWSVQQLHANIQVRDQVGRVQINHTIRNPGRTVIEAAYCFPLPDHAAIDQFVLTVNGTEMPGKVLPADEARRIYEDIVRRRKDPALLEYAGRALFRTRVFPIAPGQANHISLTYNEVYKRDGNTIRVRFPLGNLPGSTPPDTRITCRLEGSQDIATVYSPTHAIDVTRSGRTQADIVVRPKGTDATREFVLLYNLANKPVAMTLLSYRPTTSEPGFFMAIASPKPRSATTQVLPKSIVFVVDKSGSMTGKKIEQAKSSLDFLLNHLNKNDTFNIVAYDEAIRSFKAELQHNTSETRDAARRFVQQLSAGGSTNIDAALRSAMGMLTTPDRPSYVIFLTDGLPTAGEVGVPAIVQRCRQSNTAQARLLAFGVGHDVNARLLDKLVAANFGESTYVGPRENIEGPVSKVLAKLSSPVLSRIALSFPGLDQTLTYPRPMPDLFAGSQLIVLGRYHQPGPITVRLEGLVGTSSQVFEHNATLDDNKAPYANSFIETMWAQRRIGYLIDEIDLHGKNPELVAEIVRLSTRHGILTPYTSFLADDNVPLLDEAANHRRAGRLLDRLEQQVSGADGVGQRASKGSLKRKRRSAPGGRQLSVQMDGTTRAVASVHRLGGKVFFKKNGRWIDSTLDATQIADATPIKRFTEAFFELSRRLQSSSNRYLTMTGSVVVEIEGRSFLITD